jgi:polysaccharide deacetylase family protein (PEP-CTERM system associated)
VIVGVLNAMTIDVEDYFQVSAFDRVVPRSAWETMESRVAKNTRRMLDLFDAHRVRATFFVLGWVAERHGTLVREIASRGHEVASHGYGHQLVYELTPDQFRTDVRRARRVLEDTVGQPVTGYRAPSYSITRRSLWALDVLVQEGYTFDSSIFPIRHDRYGIPDAPRHPHTIRLESGTLVEVPPSTARLGTMTLPVAGGGYFRLLPYGWTRWGIARINDREKQPAIFYLHPWEIDADQPRMAVSGLTRVRHYRNLHQTETRLDRLLKDFTFGPLRSVLANTPGEIDWVPAALRKAG